MLLILVLPAPGEIVAAGHRNLLLDRRIGFFDKAADVAAANIQQDGAAKEAILALDHRGALDLLDLRNFCQRNYGTGCRDDRYLADRLGIAAKFRSVADAYREAVPALDGSC